MRQALDSALLVAVRLEGDTKKSNNPVPPEAVGIVALSFSVLAQATDRKGYFTASFKVLPAVNFGTVIAGIMILALV